MATPWQWEHTEMTATRQQLQTVQLQALTTATTPQGQSMSTNAPGQHGQRRTKISEYGLQLREKQKAKYTYGILEKQFSNLFKEALRRKGITGEILLQMCELRLDNVVYRLGLASSRSQARQLVDHKHFTVNDVVTNIPSFIVKEGDVIVSTRKPFNPVKPYMSVIKVKKEVPHIEVKPQKFTVFDDVDSIRLLKTLKGHKGSVNSVAISSDSRYIVSGGQDKIVRIWNTNSGKLLKILRGHKGEVKSIAISSDDRYIITGGDDETVRIWGM